MHTIIGEGKVIQKLKKLKEKQSFPDNEAFNLIRWFWYLGSFISFWVGAVALTIGTTDGILEHEATIGKLLSSLMFGFSVLTFSVVAYLHPKELKKLNQVVILIVVTVLLWLGSVV